MRTPLASVVAGIGTAVLVATSLIAAPVAKLAPDVIASTFFNGQPFIAATMSNVKFKMTFSADGKMKREPVNGGGAKGEGTWKLSTDGFCTTWNGAKANCYVVVSAGQNKWSVLKGSSLMATWSR